jgi:hypothetical protein
MSFIGKAGNQTSKAAIFKGLHDVVKTPVTVTLSLNNIRVTAAGQSTLTVKIAVKTNIDLSSAIISSFAGSLSLAMSSPQVYISISTTQRDQTQDKSVLAPANIRYLDLSCSINPDFTTKQDEPLYNYNFIGPDFVRLRLPDLNRKNTISVKQYASNEDMAMIYSGSNVIKYNSKYYVFSYNKVTILTEVGAIVSTVNYALTSTTYTLPRCSIFGGSKVIIHLASDIGEFNLLTNTFTKTTQLYTMTNVSNLMYPVVFPNGLAYIIAKSKTNSIMVISVQDKTSFDIGATFQGTASMLEHFDNFQNYSSTNMSRHFIMGRMYYGLSDNDTIAFSYFNPTGIFVANISVSLKTATLKTIPRGDGNFHVVPMKHQGSDFLSYLKIDSTKRPVHFKVSLYVSNTNDEVKFVTVKDDYMNPLFDLVTEPAVLVIKTTSLLVDGNYLISLGARDTSMIFNLNTSELTTMTLSTSTFACMPSNDGLTNICLTSYGVESVFPNSNMIRTTQAITFAAYDF